MKMASSFQRKPVSRVGLLILLLHLPACFSPQEARGQSNIVQLAVVNTPSESGLLSEILQDFERQSGLRVELYAGSDAIVRARNGQVDLIISHYGHADLESFMMDGLGLWPRPVFANQQAIIGPSSDPARVANLQDAVEGFRRIAQSKSPYVVNNGAIPKYVEDVLWEAAGRPPKEAWYIDLGLNADNGAQQAAAERGAYLIFGLVPFLQFQRQTGVDLRPLLVNDSVLSRTMVSVVVKPEKFPQVNTAGATALQTYLLRPSTQARIRAYRFPGLDHALWWTRGIDTSTANLGYEGPNPAISSAGIVNAANRTAGVSPGTVVEIYGANLANGTCIADTLPWPGQLACSPTRVAVSSRDAPLYYVSPGQINAQIPSDLGLGSVNVTVFRGVVPSNTAVITLVR
jgi:tungstate transport system substrate-binding protein